MSVILNPVVGLVVGLVGLVVGLGSKHEAHIGSFKT